VSKTADQLYNQLNLDSLGFLVWGLLTETPKHVATFFNKPAALLICL
jgi:hypothetical protein